MTKIKNPVLKFFHILGTIIWIILILDFIGFVFWHLTGQHPMGEFYFGTITHHIINFLLK